MTRPRLFIHIGHPKTGTTSIQSYLLAHREALRRAGILVPITGNEKGAHNGLVENFYTVRHRASQTARNDDALKQEVARSGCATVVLSSEGFIQENPARLAGLLGPGFETFILYYIRRQDLIVESVYAQRVRSYLGLLLSPIETLLPSLVPQYRKHLVRFARTFDPAHILVRPFETSAFHGGDLMSDFLTLIGADPARLPADTRRHNESLKRHYLEFKRHCNRLPLLEDEHQALGRDLARLSASDATPQPKHSLSQADRRHVLASCAEENAWIARTYLGRPDGILFTDPPPDDDAGFRPITTLPAPLQHDILERLDPGVRETLEFLDRHIRLRMPGDSFLPEIPDDPRAIEKAVDQREMEKIQRRIGRLEQRLTDALPIAEAKTGGFLTFVRQAASRILRPIRP